MSHYVIGCWSLTVGCLDNFNDMRRQLSGSNPYVTSGSVCMIFICQ